MNRPLGVKFSYLYLFGAAVLIVTAIFFYPDVNDIGLANKFGLPSFSEQPFRMIVVIVSLFVVYGYGYMRLKRRGFWFISIYSFGFGLVSYFVLLAYSGQPFAENLIWSIIVIIYFSIMNRVFKEIHGA